jgi:hypothetical protein
MSAVTVVQFQDATNWRLPKIVRRWFAVVYLLALMPAEFRYTCQRL